MKNLCAIVESAGRAALEKQGKDTVVLDMRGIVDYTDYFLVTSGESEPQVRAIADEIETKLEREGFRALHVEGYEKAGWVLIDFGELVVHIFMPELRRFYALEKLWADAHAERIEEAGE